MIERGTLYVVSTPIGNIADITLRALEILSAVDEVVCEDTRRTRGLLSHYDISKPLTSYSDHNKESRTPGICSRLAGGRSIALVSDAGTPGVSDPGFYLVREAIRQGITTVPVPGASAILASLVVSGLPTDRFLFVGFLSRKKGRRRKDILSFAKEPGTVIIYEAASRLPSLAADLTELLDEGRRVVIAREMTKRYEEIVRTDLANLSQTVEKITLKGEFVVLVSGNKG
ncbi:16S rRNA (cytidine(1402)-2'-O)-methyltransferase [candidate division WOR-3 bacterium]|uniref:Ribosomal RNA small subunit methyltransferase I n=1 Tax=candidate division WOR-3 bacterium TaxID=2052148 RepID=A0A9D5K944_UNCW3|nr:16S rRNA (cytidine(1402)-2'-O)-methyltransferase [candidate division WOR-3 bacterium]MBD3364728.1 16S rRNA (cytidine(1402)-2'-O)-methyltransferase [candidate division WOR-3 bacterium]